MSLNWNEIKIRARTFADEFADATYEKGETQTFYNAFFEVFGIKRRQVARFEELVKKLDDKSGYIDLFWPSVLLVEQKSAGRDLRKATEQAGEYFDAIKDKEKPRFQLVSDFQTFQLLDRDTGDFVEFTLAELPEKVEHFAFMIGREKRRFINQDPVSIEAAEIMGGIHDDLEASGYTGHKLEVFLVRLLFMLFADDTGIFQPRDHLLDVLQSKTKEDGSDIGPLLQRIFEVLNTPEDQRNKNLDVDLNRFPYVNGELFSETIPIADFTGKMRTRLLNAAQFNWQDVSPAIFGSLFQSVMDSAERREKGAHYTSETNILKVIRPLFLDDLRAEFDRLKTLRIGRAGRLEAFRRRLGTLTFLDPACGCGNFLVIAYRELRQLELEVMDELKTGGQLDLMAASLSSIDVDQFYGIEIEEFPARIAEVAMWMTDHIMNNRMSLAFGQIYTRIPLRKSPHIKHADALETDWNKLLPAHNCSYVFGNPPFIGSKYQSKEQRQQVRDIAKLGGSGGTLDFVAAWFLKAGEYVQDGTAEIAFVATNSISQGEQVAQLWPVLFNRYKLEISFAHRTFAWSSEARGMAHVHCVIVGLTRRDRERDVKRLFSYVEIKGDPDETRHKALTAYLFDASNIGDRHLVVKEEAKPINGLPRLSSGSQPIDDGNYILSSAEFGNFLLLEPQARKYLCPYIGAEEYINGTERWIFALQDCPPAELRAMPLTMERVKAVRTFREKSKRISTKKIANYPTKYNVELIPKSPFLIIPEVSSERREYAPIGWLKPPVIPSNKLRIIETANVYLFSLLTSAMHMAWMRQVTGRLKSDYQYGIGLVYNTFPMPNSNASDMKKIEALGEAVLLARANHPTQSLADLYDPDLMPTDLRRAHQALDRAVDKLYRKQAFASERERVEHLFALYEKMVAPVMAAAAAKPKRRRRSEGTD